MDSFDQFSQPQDKSYRAPKINFFLKIIIILLIPIVLIKIFLSLSPKPQQSPQSTPQKITQVSVTPYLTQEPTTQPTLEPAKSAPPLTQATLNDWGKKLASGSEADFKSVVELPKNKSLFPGALKTLSSFAPFQFKLDTFKKNADNRTGSIQVEAGSANKKRTALVSLQVVNGKWKIVDIKM